MKYLFVALLCLLVSESRAQFTQQKGGHSYTMDIPNYMVKTFDLNDVASLQYQNVAKAAYVVVIEDSKEHLQSAGIKFVDAKDFLEEFLKGYNKDASERRVGKTVEFTAHDNKIAQAEFTWKDDETSYYMIVSAVESQTHFYKVMTWTIADNKDSLKNDFLAISRSLKD